MLSNTHDAAAPRDLLPEVVPPLPRERRLARHLPPAEAFTWLKGGWADFKTNPAPSLLYGIALFAVSVVVVWLLYQLELDYFLFPALSGFVVIGPFIANGLYEKSRRLEEGRSTSFIEMIFVHPASGGQSIFMGVMLLGLFMLWLRAAVLLYSLIFGVVGFPGTGEILPMLFLTVEGWTLMLVGSAIGALFAAFGFAISVFAAPMLLDEHTDALTAFGLSMATVWSNLPVMIYWGAIVLALSAISILTGFLGLIIIFPVLGHATWRAYRAVMPPKEDRALRGPGME